MPTRKPPKVPNYSRKSNKKLYTIVASVGVCTILLSGVAGFAGTKIANATDSQTSVVSPTATDNTDKANRPVNTNIKVMDVSGIVETLRPSVVEITTESVSSGNSIFGQFTQQGAGSGVILSEDGYIVTNDHVVAGANTIIVKTFDGKEYPAMLCGTDSQTDIAVLKIQGEGLVPAKVGSSDDIQVGEGAIAIGNPLGSLGGTVTTGIISAVGREITIEDETMTLLQTDAAINPGNSGGGLFDLNGELIGVVNAKTSDTGIEGLGFAIPISDVYQVIEDLAKDGKVTSRPMLNVSLQDISEAQVSYGLTQLEPGCYVVQVIPGGTADQGGLKYGDRIVSFGGEEITTSSEVKNILKHHSIGDEVEMVVNRDGEEINLTLTLHGPEENIQ